MSSLSPRDGFASTSWSLVLAAARDDQAGPALDGLCRSYWRPMYAYARRSGLSPTDAEDATQDFFVYLLERSWLKQADPDRGSFRAFLLTLLRNFLSNQRRHEQAAKRGGQNPLLSLDTADCEQELAALASTEADPAAVYERTWANCVLQAALGRLAEEQLRGSDAARFEILRPFVTHAPTAGDYERLGTQLGLARSRLAVIVHRLSRRYAELIRAEVAETLTDRADLEPELRRLLGAVSH